MTNRDSGPWKAEVVDALIEAWKSRIVYVPYDVKWQWKDMNNLAENFLRTNHWASTIELDRASCEDWDTMRNIVVHELLHCALHMTFMSMCQMRDEGLIPRPVWLQWCQQHEHEISGLSIKLAAVPMWAKEDLAHRKKAWDQAL